MSNLLYNCENGEDMGVVGCFDNLDDAIFAAENNTRVKEIWSYENVNGDMGDAVECVWKFEE